MQREATAMTITERIDFVTKIPDEYMNPVLPAPPSVKIELSPRCNYRCGFCALRTRKRQPRKDMSLELFDDMVGQMRAAGVQEIGLFYLGESFSNPELLEKACEIAKVKHKFPYVFLTSNASLATPDKVEPLMYHGLDSLKWSVNAADEDQFKEVMGVKVQLMRKALANIKSAWNVRNTYGYKTRLYASSILFDGIQRDKMEELLNEQIRPYVDQAYYLPLYGMAMRSEAVRAAIGYTPTHGNAGRVDPDTGLPNREPLPCWSVFREGHVRYDGHMSACCFGSDERFDIGDLTKQSFMDAWNSPKMQEIRSAQVRTKTEGASALAGTMCDVCVAY